MKSVHIWTIGLAAALTLATAAIAQQPSQSRPPEGAKAKSSGQAAGKAAIEQQKPRVLVTISKETTYITGPLRKDGYVNYLAALNERCKKGVTRENNAAVLFWQAMGPGEIKPEMRRRYFQMLEMQPLPEHGNYFISLSKYVRQLQDAHDPRVPEVTTDGQDPIEDQLTAAIRRPWSKKEFPVIADWLAANEKPLVMLVEASKRTRWFEPLVCGDSEEGMAIAALLPAADRSREAARALVARSMLRLKDGKLDAAWDDLLDCHRFARLVGQGSTVIDALVAVAIDGMACAGDQEVLQTAALGASRVAKMREDLVRLAPLPKMADKIDVAERFMFLDCVASVAREGFSSISGLIGSDKPKSRIDSVLDAATDAAINWDVVLRMGNPWYDRLVAACRKPTRSERQAEFAKIEKDITALAAEARDRTSMAISVLLGRPRKVVSEWNGKMFVGLFLPGLSAMVNAEDRGTMQFEVPRLGFALAAYRADHGAYPERLSDLSPRYFAKVPGDIFANDGPLHYQRQGAGYLLYSVGANGRDDGGRGYSDRKEGESEDWDDLAVRVDR